MASRLVTCGWRVGLFALTLRRTAFSSLLDEIVDHARGNDHGAEIDLTIAYGDDALHIGATRLQEGARDHRRLPALTLMLTPLTEAEQRVLAHLPTNFTFAAIAEECFVSRNTVKTQAISVYRKLGVSSRHTRRSSCHVPRQTDHQSSKRPNRVRVTCREGRAALTIA
jgi:DNA-binding NarL/FixJ family response regulator